MVTPVSDSQAQEERSHQEDGNHQEKEQDSPPKPPRPKHRLGEEQREEKPSAREEPTKGEETQLEEPEEVGTEKEERTGEKEAEEEQEPGEETEDLEPGEELGLGEGAALEEEPAERKVPLVQPPPGTATVGLEGWKPKTGLGRRVASRDIVSIEEIFLSGQTIRETEIIDALVPNLDAEIIPLGKRGSRRVARRDRSGRKYISKWGVAVGNRQGLVGFGIGRDKENYNAIQKAIADAKRNLIMVRRGCGSWECRCRGTHSVPFTSSGKAGSVEMKLKPAPRGVGHVVADRIKPLFELVGIADVYSQTKGDTRTTENLAKAAIEALSNQWSIRTKTDNRTG